MRTVVKIYECHACRNLKKGVAEPCRVKVVTDLDSYYTLQRVPDSCIYGPDSSNEIMEPDWQVCKKKPAWFDGGEDNE